MLLQVRRRLGDDFFHLPQDVEPRFLGLFQGLMHDLFGQAGHFDVHLQGGNALGRARHLEVHVSQGVLVSQDIREHRHLVVFLDKTHGYPGHRRLDGHARVHQGHGCPADRGHGGGAVGG